MWLNGRSRNFSNHFGISTAIYDHQQVTSAAIFFFLKKKKKKTNGEISEMSMH
jgi:hypothetical protein